MLSVRRHLPMCLRRASALPRSSVRPAMERRKYSRPAKTLRTSSRHSPPRDRLREPSVVLRAVAPFAQMGMLHDRPRALSRVGWSCPSPSPPSDGRERLSSLRGCFRYRKPHGPAHPPPQLRHARMGWLLHWHSQSRCALRLLALLQKQSVTALQLHVRKILLRLGSSSRARSHSLQAMHPFGRRALQQQRCARAHCLRRNEPVHRPAAPRRDPRGPSPRASERPCRPNHLAGSHPARRSTGL